MEHIDQQKNLRRVVISSILGAVIEWYDFFLYGVVAGLFFNQLFFPDFDPRIGTMLAFATFAVGFVARPLGGVIFGHFGDKIGRKKVLILTLEIMGIATVAIGLIPSYATIGIWAPVLLILCRLAQGIGLGGEWGGAVLMSFESAPAHKRAFYASLPQIGMSVGLLLASGVIGLASMLLTDEAFLNWGWRMAFILSAILLIVGSYMRKTVQETKDFSEAKAKLPEAKYPLLDAFKRYPKMMLACMGARFIDGVSFNVFGVYSLTFLTQNHGIDRTHALWAVMISSVVMSVFIPVWGHVADRIGKAKVYGICALILGFASFPAFWVIENHADSFFLVCLAIGLPFGILHSAVFGTMASLFSESFDPSVRYSGISFVYQFTAIFASGLTPLFATVLTGWAGGEPWYLCAYFAIVGVLSASCTLWMRRMSRDSRKPSRSAGEEPVTVLANAALES
ncbi:MULTISPECIES: MFS transporter [Bilophila]|uniref:MFS transporter n=1 Tax=Bilophila TaxID=35832 RepID=UPI00257F782D|nr:MULTISPECIES: MFS transporter [Bilophila]MBS5456839.1 MHS family MFS transporter [Bilophila sp.]